MIKNLERVFTNASGGTVSVISSSFPARQSISVRTKLFAIILPFLSKFTVAELKTFLDGKGMDDPNVVIKLLPAFTTVLSTCELVPLILELLTYTRVNGLEVSKGEIFDSVFTGEDLLLIQILKFVIMDVNSFLARIEAGKNTIEAPSLEE